MGRRQDGLRRILDSRGLSALLRVRPGGFLFDSARLYTQTQRLDRPHHPQQGFCFLYLCGVGAGGALAPSNVCAAGPPVGRSFFLTLWWTAICFYLYLLLVIVRVFQRIIVRVFQRVRMRQ